MDKETNNNSLTYSDGFNAPFSQPPQENNLEEIEKGLDFFNNYLGEGSYIISSAIDFTMETKLGQNLATGSFEMTEINRLRYLSETKELGKGVRNFWGRITSRCLYRNCRSCGA